MTVTRHTLTTLQYSTDRKGPWVLYLYDNTGYHSGKQWFGKRVRYSEEEITVATAKARAEAHERHGLEVRVTDGGDNLVYHSKNGKVVYPETGDFWKEIGA